MKIVMIPAFCTAFIGGMYWEINRVSMYCPVGTIAVRNNLGILVFTLFALLCGSIAGYVLRSGMQRGQWSEADMLVFYGGLLLGAVFLVLALEFLLLGEFRFENPFPFVIARGILLVLLIWFLVRGWGVEKSKGPKG